MTKRSNNDKDRNPTENESEEIKADAGESTSVEGDAAESNSDALEGEASVDDLLDDVRRSLIEDDQDDKKKPGWLNRIKKGFQKEQPAEMPQTGKIDAPIEPMQSESKSDEYIDQIDELIDMLEPDDTQPAVEAIDGLDSSSAVMITPPAAVMPEEPAAPIDLGELKKRVFNPGENAPDESSSAMRAVALEGGEDVFIEVEAKKADPMGERVQAFENAMRPYRQYVYFLIAFFGVLLAVVAIGMMSIAYQRSRPPAPTPTFSNLPYPQTMILPGGLNFSLGRGAIVEGTWNPSGPEWLAGTEVCRWVAIPWSKQLEAVVRTLTPEDVIELLMSNNDRLAYNVFSIQQLTLAEMDEVGQNSPCLLLVLAKADEEKRWVVTAKP